MDSLNNGGKNLTMTKEGNWMPVASGAVDARDKLRKADVIVAELQSKTRDWCEYEWVSVSSVETALAQIRQLIGQASTDLTLGLKGRTQKANKVKRSVVK